MFILLFAKRSEVGANEKKKNTVFAKNCSSDGCKLSRYRDHATGKRKNIKRTDAQDPDFPY